jgi:hypothetical protein
LRAAHRKTQQIVAAFDHDSVRVNGVQDDSVDDLLAFYERRRGTIIDGNQRGPRRRRDHYSADC